MPEGIPLLDPVVADLSILAEKVGRSLSFPALNGMVSTLDSMFQFHHRRFRGGENRDVSGLLTKFRGC